MPNRRHAIAGIATTLLAAAPSVVRSQQLVAVRVASTLDDNATPILYGQQSGIFKRHGLDVTLQTFSSGAAQAAAVASGAIDIGKTSLFSIITAHLRGVAFKLVAGSGLYLSNNPNTGLIVAKDSPIKSGADLAGKTAACASLRDLDEISIRGWADQHGGDSSTMKFVELPNAAVAQALEVGRVDAATLVNPTLFNATQSGRIRLLGRSFDSIGRRFLVAVWFCQPALGERSPDTLRRFREAFREAATYTNGHHEETVELIAAFSRIDPDVIRKMTRATTALTLQAGDLQPPIDAAVKYKMIEKGFPAAELLAV
jgi:NitT/TauT family transport system substrate-binding protein